MKRAEQALDSANLTYPAYSPRARTDFSMSSAPMPSSTILCTSATMPANSCAIAISALSASIERAR